MGNLVNTITKGIYKLNKEIWEEVSNDAKDLVKKLLEVDPNKRLSATEALNHRWILQD